MQAARRLRLILGDQLNHNHSWFQEKDDGTLYVLMEIRPEATYVKHHIQKIIGFFLAMRSFADHLQDIGHRVKYFHLNDPDNKHSFADNLQQLVEDSGAERIEYQLPDEYRLDRELAALSDQLSVAVKAVDSEHFLTKRMDLKEFFAGKKQYLMESFYRDMRKRLDIMMEPDGKTPLTGQWNYDASNRKKLPKKETIPEGLAFKRDVSELVKLLEKEEIETIGTVEPDQFDWPVTREDFLELLEHFCKTRLHRFGDYQDAMTTRDELLFHSRLSFGLNVKLISPLEVVRYCVDYWEKHQEAIDISQIEGFVRQIIGWREYMRGVYWAHMPEYADLNFFDHQAKLPSWFWTGDTQMKCLQHAIGQSLEGAYAHHIQRLMVTGNFALLLGVHPDEVDAWYLGIYMDAVEWVEITNTRGMSQFADGGIVGTKPYVASANYMHKMGDYCSQCAYDRKKKVGEGACPFNSLYWDFYDRHEDKLARNPRIGMMYRVWAKRDPEEKAAILEQADYYKKHIEEL
jgi:deoxyribodipyrimidine photolyase-related protein